MRTIKYILVNESNHQHAADAVHNSTVSAIRYGSTIVNTPRQWRVPGSKDRAELIDQLCKLRRHWPEAKILGVSELDVSASHAPVRVNPEMNALRRELSDLP